MTETELIKKIEDELDNYDDKKDLSRNVAIGIKLITAILGGMVTVLLGWKMDGKPVELLTNFALICGAVIAVMNIIDTFGSFSAHWASYKATCTELIFLLIDVKRKKNLSQNEIDLFDHRLDEIIKDAKKSSVELRQKTK